MADQHQDDDGHPVVSGLLALVGVGLAVGLWCSGAALAATSVLGLGEATVAARPRVTRPSTSRSP